MRDRTHRWHCLGMAALALSLARCEEGPPPELDPFNNNPADAATAAADETDAALAAAEDPPDPDDAPAPEPDEEAPPGGAAEALHFLFFGRLGNAIDDLTRASAYLQATAAEPTIAQWLARRCMGPDRTLQAPYLNTWWPAGVNEVPEIDFFNRADLRLGRGMFFATCGERIIALVNNYGVPGQPVHEAFLGFDQAPAAAAVGMDYDPSRGADYAVQFYLYVRGEPDTALQFDSERPKPLPMTCTMCHGGVYEEDTGLVRGASFLPLMLESLDFQRFTPTEEERLRRANALVRLTNPPPGVRIIIDAAYPDGVERIGATYQRDRVPDSWAEAPDEWRSLVRPYCAGCHAALGDVRGFHIDDATPFLTQRDRVRALTCGNPGSIPLMPQAEVTRRALDADPIARNIACGPND
ncbi:MAG: hypothetical protein KC620_14315 [Myxococcales bacterium]|nr:hypothetical protein [Myxococcales bacterium]